VGFFGREEPAEKVTAGTLLCIYSLLIGPFLYDFIHQCVLRLTSTRPLSLPILRAMFTH